MDHCVDIESKRKRFPDRRAAGISRRAGDEDRSFVAGW
jgi:hypothetical protein